MRNHGGGPSVGRGLEGRQEPGLLLGVDGKACGLGGGEATRAGGILGRPLDEEDLGKHGMRETNEDGEGVT